MTRLTPRLTAVILAAAAALTAVTLPATAADHDHHRDGDRDRRDSSVVLGDVQYNSPGRDDRSNRSLNAEWVDVTNTGRRSADLDEWTLSDEDGHSYTFDLRLRAGQTVRVHTGTGRDTDRNIYQGRRNYVWNNDHDTATLRDDRGRLVDTESWGRRHDRDRDRDRDDRRGDGRRR